MPDGVMPVTEHAVVIAGAGPTGTMLAGELALAEVDVAIVERRTGRDLDGSRAGALHSHTIEVLDHRGVANRFLARGRRCRSRSTSRRGARLTRPVRPLFKGDAAAVLVQTDHPKVAILV
jgi:2-polyprenyl-6-methoxyphenol hydroxylase-like FAD-dependent oxidoreductase